MKNVPMLLLCILFSACASRFNSISPQTFSYQNSSTEKNVSLAYHHDILRERGNRKYAKKGDRKNIRLVAIKITNNTSRSLVFGSDIRIMSGENEAVILDRKTVFRSLRQLAPFHLFYLLLTPVQLSISRTQPNGRIETDSFPIGLVLGPGLSVFNLLKALMANGRLKEELMQYDLTNKSLMPGQTCYGIIAVRDVTYNNLTAKVIN